MVLTVAAVLVLPRIFGVTGPDLASADSPPTSVTSSAARPSADSSSTDSSSAGSSSAGSSTPTPTRTPAPTGPLHLVGFGDSVMAGAGCDCDDFLTRVGAGLHAHTGRKVVTDNNGTNGETAAGLLRELKTDDALQAEITRADVIVLTIGANDLGPALGSWNDDDCGHGCYQPQIDDMADRLDAILAVVNAHKKPTAVVLVTSYWNVFEDGDVGASDYGKGYLDWSDTVTRAANVSICQAARQGGSTCVDTYAPFKADGGKDPTGLLADDGDHPNDKGAALIAQAVLSAAEARL